MSGNKNRKKESELARNSKPEATRSLDAPRRDFMDPGLDFDAPTQELWKALRGNGHIISVKRIAAAIAAGGEPNARNEFGVSMLFLAIENDSPAGHPLITMIFEAGASLVDKRGETPEMDYAKKLLDSGECHNFLIQLDQARKERLALERAIPAAAGKSASKPRI